MGQRRIWWLIGWRNLWRHRRRTAITAGALAFGFFAGTLVMGMSAGLVAEMIDSGTTLVDGHVQLHQAGFKPERSLYTTVGGRRGVDIAAVRRAILEVPGVVGVTPRVFGGGLVSSGEETVAGLLLGIDTEHELTVSRFVDSLSAGRMPAPGAMEVLVGREMAAKLNSVPGDTLVLVAGAADGSMANDLVVLAGVYHSGSRALDGAYLVLPLATAQDFLVLERTRVHEFAVRLSDPWLADQVAPLIGEAVSPLAPEVVAEPWTIFRRDMAQYAALAQSSYWIIVIIVFGMAMFGVANTMLMATFERRREFAVVRALGSRPAGVVQTVVAEGVLLGVLALTAGALITLPVLLLLESNPIDLSLLVGEYSLAGASMQANLTVVITWQAPLISAGALFVTSMLAALYPALRAARVPPADALAGAD